MIDNQLGVPRIQNELVRFLVHLSKQIIPIELSKIHIVLNDDSIEYLHYGELGLIIRIELGSSTTIKHFEQRLPRLWQLLNFKLCQVVQVLEDLSRAGPTYVSNLKKCLGNANLHVSLNDIKIDKTLRFVEEPVEIMDREVKSLKHSRIPLVKVRWNSKRGPEFTWEREDYMKSKYPQLFVDRAVEPTS
ncbi:hypothetical protein Tco_0876564 [Tanacetum coccineum]|uniref:Reverse transcriptase domain-containing protein n=1 Tax=Tanacetum coccineum TaxID=301880 RepID=A0ABQ5BU81_9ASTR